MAGWSKLDSTPGRRVYSRPLGVTEVGFFWDSIFSGTADCIVHLQLRVPREEDYTIYSDQSITRAWTSLKQRFPLLVSQIQTHSSGAIEFLVREERLSSAVPSQLTFKDVASSKEAEQLVLDLLDGPRPLSDDLLARVYVLRRTDRKDIFHVMFMLAHCITDGSSNSTIQRTFLDTLSSRSEEPIPPLEDRLTMVISSEERVPTTQLRAPLRRWRKAIGFAIYTVRMARIQGGQTLPRKFTASTFRSPGRSRVLVSTLTPEQTITVLANCRLNGVTLGNATLALSQVAMSRVLYRRFLRGDISASEWEHRKKQPMHSGGPLNLRPFLDQQWYNRGGGGDVFLAISFYFYTLPFMSVGMTDHQDPRSLDLVDGAPSFGALLSFKRFLLRSRLVARQAQRFMRHPLFLEIALSAHSARIERTKMVALEWKRRAESGQTGDSDENIPPLQQEGSVFGHGGSSIGNVDAIIPLEYPVPASHPLSPLSGTSHPSKAGYLPRGSSRHVDGQPRLLLEYSRTHLQCRPAELYLGTSTSRKQLHSSVFFDANVYDPAVVQEWLDEVSNATLWYLGQPHPEGGRSGAKL
ncbi:hypothetical protein BV22DRAFT_1131716 [Leucogyrophana mollusca]|uniref:Uncharacterized protein n=1 Tax=Leucogyrophana mollusca TaxID=85980 RepID=A0ACB8B8G5_9AGAM|nr:hypothetical protein BV22DRAFT_1131716 [Leucogyrophana mollusca]